MKINLNEKEIHQAIIEFIGSEGIDLSTKQVNIELTAGRKPNGFYADVTIGEQDEPSETEIPDDNPFKDDLPDEDDQALDI